MGLGVNFQHVATPISTTAGSFIAIATTVIYASSIMLEADAANTGKVYVGSSGVTTTNGSAISPGKSWSLSFDPARGVNNRIVMSSVFLATDTTANLVRVFYLEHPA